MWKVLPYAPATNSKQHELHSRLTPRGVTRRRTRQGRAGAASFNRRGAAVDRYSVRGHPVVCGRGFGRGQTSLREKLVPGRIPTETRPTAVVQARACWPRGFYQVTWAGHECGAKRCSHLKPTRAKLHQNLHRLVAKLYCQVEPDRTKTIQLVKFSSRILIQQPARVKRRTTRTGRLVFTILIQALVENPSYTHKLAGRRVST